MKAQPQKGRKKAVSVRGREPYPQFASKCHFTNHVRCLRRTSRLAGNLFQKIFVHHRLFTVRIKETFCQLNGLPNHDPHRHIRNMQISRDFQRLADKVPIMYKCLIRQLGIFFFNKPLALPPRIDDQPIGTERTTNLNFATDRLNKSLKGR